MRTGSVCTHTRFYVQPCTVIFEPCCVTLVVVCAVCVTSQDVEYSVSHRGQHFYITYRDASKPNSELRVAPMSDPTKHQVRWHHMRLHVQIEASCWRLRTGLCNVLARLTMCTKQGGGLAHAGPTRS